MTIKRILELNEYKKAIKESKEDGSLGLRKNVAIQAVEQIKNEDGTDSRTLRFIISTKSVDRDNDTIDPNGWDISAYMKNPTVLFGHDGRSPPVAKANSVFLENNMLMADAQFMEKDLYEFSDMLYRMYQQGFMKATSVGFNPSEYTWSDDRDYGIDFTKQELLEFSLVPVPSNPDAIIQAKDAGINTSPLTSWAEEVLDTKLYKGLIVPSSVIEKMRKDADGKSKVTIWLDSDGVTVEAETEDKDTKDMKVKSEDLDADKKDKVATTKSETDSKAATEVDETAKNTETATDDTTVEETDKTTASETEKAEALTLADFETDKDTGFLKLKSKKSPDKDTTNEDEDKGDSDKEKDFIDDLVSAFGTDDKEGETKSEDNTDDMFKGLDLSAEDLAEAIGSAVKSEVAKLTGKLD